MVGLCSVTNAQARTVSIIRAPCVIQGTWPLSALSAKGHAISHLMNTQTIWEWGILGLIRFMATNVELNDGKLSHVATLMVSRLHPHHFHPPHLQYQDT